MAEDPKNSKVIRKNDPDFPAYLDFDKLRKEGIEYLGKLAGKLWTDHNVHDPGITMLEVLCYAVLDLGYRTNLPEEDILTPNPAEKSGDINFFTPGQILSCNPLTITDYRKMLVDLEGVRNAWLEVATDIKDICRETREQPSPNDEFEREERENCQEFLNGLYHVYVDLEKDLDRDFKNTEDKEKHIKLVLGRVKKALMRHRNLCEDFQDVYVLCKLQTGVCAEVELKEGADPEKVFISVVEALQAFFSPAPRFYSLQQLLDKGKSIEDIFAGRPHNLSESHGFVDTEEFEQIIRRKEIHLSDVFEVIFKVEGVKSVRNLQIIFCRENGRNTTHSEWNVKIPDYHIPEFSTACSGFRFIRNSAPLPLDFEKFGGLFDFRFSQKFLYTAPSPYLDAEIPKGYYHAELEDYYSIQNEFPRVYGIEEGGLPKDAPPARKAQALQLKGYLLFFDQLLANYLSQISNIRSLFSLSSPEKKHTYFINQLSSVPDLQKLLFFQTAGAGINQRGNVAGSTLVFPVDKQKLMALKEQDKLKNLDIDNILCDNETEGEEGLAPYNFATNAELELVISQLKNDFLYEAFTIEMVSKSENCVYFYILSSSEEIALLSKKYYPDINTAKHHACSIPYIGTFEENYHSFPNARHHFSFTLELNLASFSNYLQLMVEDRDLYAKRRQGFLKHLLARFAETFTDYAALSYDSNQQKEGQIQVTERFLTHYDEISSERGNGYDYHLNSWKNDNVSGFEKRTKALSGMENWGRHSICNFEVVEKEDQFQVDLTIANEQLFKLTEKFDSLGEGQRAAQSFITNLSDRQHYKVQPVPYEQAYAIKIYQNQRETASFRTHYATETEAWEVVTHLHRLFATEPLREDVYISQYIYDLHLLDHEGHLIRTSEKKYDTEATAQTAANQLTKGVNDAKRWHIKAEGKDPGRLHRLGEHEGAMQYLDLDAFKIDINDAIVGKPDKFSYELLDKQNRFKFSPIKEFDHEKEAKKHWEELLLSMADEENYQLSKNEENNQWALHVLIDGEVEAESYKEFRTEEEALQLKEEALAIIQRHIYELQVHEEPYRWKFNFFVGIEPGNRYAFESEEAYESEEDALAANDEFRKSLSKLRVQEDGDELKIRPKKKDSAISPIILKEEQGKEEKKADKSTIKQWMEVQAEVSRLKKESTPEDFEASVARDLLSQQGSYVYRLIDKDHVPAVFNESFLSEDGAKDRKRRLAKLKCEDYPYLKICLGGNIFIQRKNEKTSFHQYHFQLKILHLPAYPDQEVVLFESIKGYTNQEEAEKAFLEQYLQILSWASERANYGTGKKIVPEEEMETEASQTSQPGKTLVFIPKETMEVLGREPEAVFAELVKIAGSYPIRRIEFGSDLFYELFPCEEKPEKSKEKECKDQAKKYVHYFRLQLPNEGEEGDQPYWQSTKFYEGPEEARQAFNFFLMLLCYSDNLFVDCDDCQPEQSRYRIYIREVLAESTRRFKDEAEAWGKEGLQKFICITQSQNAFHLYQRKDDCCYTFYVACMENRVIHPCKYSTASKRDELINQLYQEFNGLYQHKAYQSIQEEVQYLLTNHQGAQFARVFIRHYNDPCATLPELFEKMARKQLDYEEQENGDILLFEEINGEREVLASSITGYALEEWKALMEDFACYYPIVKVKDEENEKVSFCIEIKLPGFNSCAEDQQQEDPCLCGEKEDVAVPACYVAWKSRCCYSSCEQALGEYNLLVSLLLDHNSYRPLLDCACYEFGIALHYEFYERNKNLIDDRLAIRLRDNEIIARNPQCYPHTKMLCEATERAWKLINSEGLHVVEHILLRPRQEKDCECEEYRRYCENEIDCPPNEFIWKVPEPHPCEELTDICFIPGADPYSFIATVALPAWPLRFRKEENRQQLEKMLYREAPAHVLLRILWLAPHDFCCFEKKYRKWGRWLAHKKNCVEPFSTCDFMQFLFQRNYECLEDCEVCLPCPEDEEQVHPCFTDNEDKQTEDANTFLKQINELYCWKEQHCDEYEFISCEQGPIIIEGRGDEDEWEEREAAEALTGKPEEEKAESPQEESLAATPLKPKPRLVNGRLAKYRSAVDQLAKENDNEVIAKARLLIQDPHPSVERVSGLLTEVLQQETKKAAGEQALSKEQQFELVQYSLCYFLDKVCFEEKEIDKITALQEPLEKLKKAKVDLQAVYQYWDAEEVEKYEAQAPLSTIKELLTGSA